MEDEVVGLTDENNALMYVLLSIASFLLTNKVLYSIAPSRAVTQGPTTVWKWVNTANSLIHSFVTGIGASLCCYDNPGVYYNVISTYSDFSHKLVCYSVGYFIFDFIDMLMYHRKRSSYELMVHHVFVLSCFILSVSTRYYLGFTIISLVVEVNSIFLHLRQLLLITLTPKHTQPYRTVSVINLVTFVTFRISTLGWMTLWVYTHAHLVNLIPYIVGFISINGLLIMSFILLYRLIKADFT